LENAISQEALLEMLGPGHWRLNPSAIASSICIGKSSLSRLEERWLKEADARPSIASRPSPGRIL
jgi:hypothetical protein